jgi:hypothetical protein
MNRLTAREDSGEHASSRSWRQRPARVLAARVRPPERDSRRSNANATATWKAHHRVAIGTADQTVVTAPAPACEPSSGVIVIP